MEENTYYVYGCYVDGVLRYIGKGEAERYKHCMSGRSTSWRLNEDVKNNRDMRVEIFQDGLCEDQALELERILIKIHSSTLYNVALRDVSVTEDFNTDATWPLWMFRATGYISPVDGKERHLKLSHRAIMMAIHNILGSKLLTDKPIHISQYEIGFLSNIEYRTVARCTKDLIEDKVLLATKNKPTRGRERWFYSGFNPDVQWYIKFDDLSMYLKT